MMNSLIIIILVMMLLLCLTTMFFIYKVMGAIERASKESCELLKEVRKRWIKKLKNY